MAFNAADVGKLKVEITKEDGILAKINDLAMATPEQQSSKIVPLIGAIIGLLMTAIEAAMD